MPEPQLLSLVAVVSQVVFALTLGLLAASDRRTRGTLWFASACTLRFLFSLSHSWQIQGYSPTLQALGSCLLILVFFCTYMGVRWFTLREPVRQRSGPAMVSCSMLVTLVLAVLNPAAAVGFARLVAVVLIFQIIPLLRRTEFAGIDRTARWATYPFIGFSLTLLARVSSSLVPAGPWTDTLHLVGSATAVLCSTAIAFSFVAFYVAEVQRRLHDETRIDALTGLRNRRCMEESAARLVRATGSRPLSLLVIDVDNFKRLNDTWGHAVGDRALQALGDVLRQRLSGSDFAARMGGEEFAVMLPNRDLQQSALIADSLRKTIARLSLPEGDHVATFSVSIGVSSLMPGERIWIDMLRRADKALYRAKHGGRNQVCTWCESDGIRGTRNDSRIVNWRRSWSSSHTRVEANAAEAVR